MFPAWRPTHWNCCGKGGADAGKNFDLHRGVLSHRSKKRRLERIQFLKPVQAVQRLHQLLFREAGRQAQGVEQRIFPLGAARCAGEPPIVEIGVLGYTTKERGGYFVAGRWKAAVGLYKICGRV